MAWFERLVDFVASLSNGLRLHPVHLLGSRLAPAMVGAPALEPVRTRPLRMSRSDSDDAGDTVGAAAEAISDVSLDDLEDRALVSRVLDGDQAAYGQLVQRYQSKIFAVAYGVLRNREDAREVAQDVFIKAYRNLPSFRRDSSFYTWMYRITVNLAIDAQRKAYRKRETTFEDVRLSPDEVNSTGPRPAADPEEHLERKRLGMQINDAIDQLPSDQRTAIILREIQGLSYKEIADTMGCAEGTVMSRLFYARKKLQELLKDTQ